MQRDLASLQDIIDPAQTALRYISDVDEVSFFSQPILQDACIRRLEIIGEASRRISNQTREKYPSLPWRDMIAMRNLMIHEYDRVDPDFVWKTMQNDLPQIIIQLEEIFRTLRRLSDHESM